MHSFALNYIGNIRFSEKIEKIDGSASSRLNEAHERDDSLQLQHRSRGSAPTMPSSGRAARVQHVHCPCVAAPTLLFSLTPSLARLAPSSALLPRVQCAANLPVCAFARALGHARNTSAGAPGPLPLSPPGRIRGKLSHGRSPPRGALSQLPPVCVRAPARSSPCPRVPATLQLHLHHARASVRPQQRCPCGSSARTTALGGLRATHAHLPACCACCSPSNTTRGLRRPPPFHAISPICDRGSAPLFSLQALRGRACRSITPYSHLHALARTPACSGLTSRSPLRAPLQHAARPEPGAPFLWPHAPEPRASGSNRVRLKNMNVIDN
jgi:hypothetical protein